MAALRAMGAGSNRAFGVGLAAFHAAPSPQIIDSLIAKARIAARIDWLASVDLRAVFFRFECPAIRQAALARERFHYRIASCGTVFERVNGAR